MGIGIDIFPFDYIPENTADLKWMFWRNNQIGRLHRFVFSYNLTGWRKWIARPCFIILYKLIGNKRLIKWRDRNFAAYTETDAPRYGNLVFQVGNERGFFRKEVFKDRIKVPFEYVEAYIPIGYEEYLTHLYGANWRTPIRGAGSHQALVIDAEQPYKKLLVEQFGYKPEWVKDLP
jgi:phosphorylcholine metabolism protein LicD